MLISAAGIGHEIAILIALYKVIIRHFPLETIVSVS